MHRVRLRDKGLLMPELDGSGTFVQSILGHSLQKCIRGLLMTIIVSWRNLQVYRAEINHVENAWPDSAHQWCSQSTPHSLREYLKRG